MLVDLQTLDVVVSHADADCDDDGQKPDTGLRLDGTTESAAGDHERAGVGGEDEEDDDVAVDAMEDEEFVADGGDELEDDE